MELFSCLLFRDTVFALVDSREVVELLLLLQDDEASEHNDADDDGDGDADDDGDNDDDESSSNEGEEEDAEVVWYEGDSSTTIGKSDHEKNDSSGVGR